jgi:peptidoglycan hydrolase-like protein with peptidoglycan-binding domain
MNVVVARLLFLAFVGLTGFIIYNALYLQEQRPIAVLPTAPKALGTKPMASGGSASLAATLPPLPAKKAPSQLVTAIQRELKVRGYGGGPADGTLRDETRKAIADFERDHGLAVSGLPSDELLRHILLGETVSTGTLVAADKEGPSDSAPRPKEDIVVKQVQQILADLGYAPGPVDGAMGSATEGAVKAFQHDRKIAETGRISSELLREIKRVTGRDLADVASR